MEPARDFLKYVLNSEIGRYNVIHPSVIIGKNVSIGHHNVIHEGVVLGDGTVVGSYCELGANLHTGKNVIIQGRVRTGDNCELRDGVVLKYGTILTEGVLVKEDAFFGPNTITFGSTHERVEKHGTVIGKRSYIGGGATIAADTQIADDVVIGAMSFVNKDIEESGIYVGIPVERIK